MYRKCLWVSRCFARTPKLTEFTAEDGSADEDQDVIMSDGVMSDRARRTDDVSRNSEEDAIEGVLIASESFLVLIYSTDPKEHWATPNINILATRLENAAADPKRIVKFDGLEGREGSKANIGKSVEKQRRTGWPSRFKAVMMLTD